MITIKEIIMIIIITARVGGHEEIRTLVPFSANGKWYSLFGNNMTFLTN